MSSSWFVSILLFVVADAIPAGHSLEGHGRNARACIRALHGETMAAAEELSVEMTLAGQDLKFNVTAMPSLSPEARMTHLRKNGSEEFPAPRVPYFRSTDHSAILVFLRHGFTALVKHNGSFYDVTTLRGTSNESLDLEVREIRHNRSFLDKALVPDFLTPGRKLEETRQLQFSDDLEQWTDCYSQDYIERSLTMGVAIGSKLFSELGANPDEVVEWMISQIAKANMVYEQQLNVRLQLGHLVYVSSYEGYPEWDQGQSCPLTIEEQLIGFSEWEPPYELGLWHLLDDCAYIQDCSNGVCTTGIAWRGSMCDNNLYSNADPSNGIPMLSDGRLNTGVSRYTDNTWLTFAHEVGHNFGAHHSFENGEGTTGGIMDYGDKTLDGVYQFNTEFRKTEMCETIDQALSSGCPYLTSSASSAVTSSALGVAIQAEARNASNAAPNATGQRLRR